MNSKFADQRLPLSQLKTEPLLGRKSKVHIEHFATPSKPGQSIAQFLGGLPQILMAKDFLALVDRMAEAVAKKRGIVAAMGAHVIKCGLSPVLIDLMERGIITGLALNGAGIIHDFEIALSGQTSEDVDQGIVKGEFGMAQETGQILNRAINEGVAAGLGLGEAVGKRLVELQPPYEKYSLLASAYKLNLPATVHIAIGTDIIHMHPEARGDWLGQGSLDDFRLFCSMIRSLHEGGVYLNIGSAVILPEVFLKAVTLVRNLGYPLRDFTTANFDFIQHYRPNTNVVRRPIIGGGTGFSFTGHHELMIPLLAAAIINQLKDETPIP